MRLCKDSTNPLCHGWPGGMNAWSVSCSLAQRPTAPAINSGPLSALSAWGCSMGQDSQVKHFDHVGGSHAPLDAESQVLTGELIDNVTDLEHVPLPIRIKLEINGPHLPRRVLRELPHGHPFCPATSSQDYSEQPSQNKRSEKPRPLHKTQTPPRRIVEVVFNAQDAVAADVGVSLQLPGWWLHGLRESGAAR